MALQQTNCCCQEAFAVYQGDTAIHFFSNGFSFSAIKLITVKTVLKKDGQGREETVKGMNVHGHLIFDICFCTLFDLVITCFPFLYFAIIRKSPSPSLKNILLLFFVLFCVVF